MGRSRWWTAAVVAAALAVSGGPASADPDGDDLADARPVGALPFSAWADLAAATSEPGEAGSACGGPGQRTVWFRVEADRPSRLRIDVTAPEVDPVVSIWVGSAHPLQEVTCSDDAREDLSASVVVSVPAGGEVLVRVDAHGSDARTSSWRVDLRVAAATGPAHDDRASALARPLPFADEADLLDSGVEPGEPSSACGPAPRNGLWYRLTSPGTGRVRLDVAGTGMPVVLSAWTGDRERQCTVLDAESTAGTAVVLTVPPGQAIDVRVEGWFDEPWLGPSRLRLAATAAPPGPPGDDLAGALELGSPPSSRTVVLGGAGVELDEALPDCQAAAEHAVWLRMVPAESGRVAVATDREAPLSLWSGDGHPLAQVACRPEDRASPVIVPVVAGTPVYVRLAGEVADVTVTVTRAAPGPPGDDLAGAVEVWLGMLPFEHHTDTSAAGVEPGEAASACGDDGSRAVWFRLEPTEPTLVLADTAGSEFDTVLSVWTGSAHPLTEVTCMDDESDTSVLTALPIHLEAGTTYYLRAGGVGDESGRLALAILPPPPNDALADAIEPAALPFSHVADGRLATTEQGEEVAPCVADADHGLWYRYRPGDDARLRLDARGSDHDTAISVWEGDEHPLGLVACEDHVGGGGPLSSLTVAVEAGEEYLIKVESQDAAIGRLALNASIAPAGPPGDDAADAPDLGAPDEAHVDTHEAGWEPYEAPAPCGAGAGHGVWWRYRPAADGRVRLDTLGTPFDTVLSVWRPGRHPLEPLACGAAVGTGDPDGSLTMSVRGGDEYLIKAEGRQSRAGALTVRSRVPPAGPDGDDLAAALAVDALPFVRSIDAREASIEPEEAQGRGDASPRSVWLRHVPSSAASVELEAVSADAAPSLTVWVGPPFAATRHPMPLAMCQELGDERRARLRCPMARGTTYFVRVAPAAGADARVDLRIAGAVVATAWLPWAGRRVAPAPRAEAP